MNCFVSRNGENQLANSSIHLSCFGTAHTRAAVRLVITSTLKIHLHVTLGCWGGDAVEAGVVRSGVPKCSWNRRKIISSTAWKLDPYSLD
eukprot:1270743-Amphidinium_carterae.1